VGPFGAEGPFRRARDGTILVRLEPNERELLRSLAHLMQQAIDDGDRGDDAVARLFPRAYLDPTEEGAESEWQKLAGADLVTERLDRLASLADATQAKGDIRLDEEGVAVWMGVINDARLFLGVRLGVTEDDDLYDLPGDDPRAYLAAVYGWLTFLLGELVDLVLRP
jgi:hypothetical protein